MPVAGIPLVHRIIRWLVPFGVTDIVLNLHHRPETIARVVGDGRDLGVRVRYSWEPRLLGSGGGPRRALPLFETDRCLVINGDTLADVDLHAMAAAHARAGAAVTMALVPNPDPWWYGGVVLDEASRITRFTTSLRRQHASSSSRAESRDQPPAASSKLFHFVGVQLVERDVFGALPEGEPAESVSGLYRALIAEGTRIVQGFPSEATFYDIGTPSDYLQTSLTFARAEGHGDRIPAGLRTTVSPEASLTRSAVWDDVTVRPGAELTDCIVTDRVEVPADVRLARAILIAQDDCAAVEAGRIIGNARMFPLEEGTR